MLIIPAIDIKEGAVVRLFQGKFSDQKTYSKDPLKTAKHWAAQGAQFLHIVDLDGAASGAPVNIGIAKEIAKNASIPVEFGGGVRDFQTIEDLLNSGVSRVVLGTRAAQDKDFLKKSLAEFKDKIIVSIDAKEGKVSTRGWQEDSNTLEALDFALALKEIGFKEFIYTDISKDGTLKGPSIKQIKALLKQTGLKIIASGGVSCLDDIRKLKSLEKEGVSGVIIGKALYEGKFTLKEAVKLS